MEEPSRSHYPAFGLPKPANSRVNGTHNPNEHRIFGGPRIRTLKKRGHGTSRSWIKIGLNGDSKVLELDKATIMRHCSLPARDLRLLDPLFIYPSTVLGREKAIVVSLEQIRCIITAEEVILMNSLDQCVVQYRTELARRLQSTKEQSDDLPFEFKALELAFELTCMSLDAQVKELEIEIYPVVDELASSISTQNLERARRLKGQLLTLTQRVQKVHDEMEHLMDDDDDMAEMYLTEKKMKFESYNNNNPASDGENAFEGGRGVISKSAPVSPVGSDIEEHSHHRLQRAYSHMMSSSRHGSFTSSSTAAENIAQLEMLLEAYFVVIGHSLTKLLSNALSKNLVEKNFSSMMQLKEYIDDTEDLININLGNVQNQLIQFELIITAATFVATIFASVTAVFGMNFETNVFEFTYGFHWVLVVTGIFGASLFFTFLMYFKYKKIFPL